MKACVSTGIREIKIQDVEKPKISEGEALIKVHYCGICGSDLAGYQYGDPFSEFPHIFGHEASGEIVELGSESEELKVGDRVTYEITVPCFECKACKQGKTSDCSNIKILGGHLQGAFAEYVKVPYYLIHKTPDDMPYEHSALAEPYTIASRGIDLAEVKKGENILILGAGNIALCAIDIAKVKGANVIVAARRKDRLENAKAFGADILINTKIESLSDAVDTITNGTGCDVVIDCTGAKEVIEEGLKNVARGGRFVLIGMANNEISINSFMIVEKTMKIIGSMNSYGQFPYILKLLYNNELHSNEFLSDVFDYTKAQEAFEYAIRNAGKCRKVLLKFD